MVIQHRPAESSDFSGQVGSELTQDCWPEEMLLVENKMPKLRRSPASSVSSVMRLNAPKGLIKSGFESTMDDESLSDTGWSLTKSMSMRINIGLKEQLNAVIN